MLTKFTSRARPQKKKLQREKGTSHGMVRQHDVEEREQGRRLGNEKWKEEFRKTTSKGKSQIVHDWEVELD